MNSIRLFKVQEAIRQFISKNKNELERYQVYLLNKGRPIQTYREKVCIKCLISDDYGLSKKAYKVTLPKSLYYKNYINKEILQQLQFKKM